MKKLIRIAPERMKGAYFGAQNFTFLGLFISPILGGFLLDVYNGRIMYIVLGVVALASIGVYGLGFRQQKAGLKLNVEKHKEAV